MDLRGARAASGGSYQQFDSLDPNDPQWQAKVDRLGEINGVEVNMHRIDPHSFELPNYGRSRQQMREGAAAAGNRQGVAIDQGPQDAWRQQQMGLAQALQAQAYGTGGPSAAELQMGRGLDTNMAQAMAMQAAQRGQNAGGNMRAIANQRATMGQQSIADTGLLRAQEQMAAQNQYGQMLAGARGLDIGLASGQAQLDATQRAQNDQMTQYYLNMGFNLDQAKLAAKQAYETQMGNRYALNKGLAVQQQGQQAQLIGAGLNAGGAVVGAIAASDRRLKKDIRNAEGDTYSFLDALNAARYSYKEPKKFGEGERVSVMAQELEKSSLGRGFVKDTPEGKMVDYGKGLGTMLAASASLHKRLKALEGRDG